MSQDFTLHTHTVGFDGRDSVQAMVNRARDLGFKTIGISNHFIVNPIIKYTKMYPYSVRGGYSNIYSSSFHEVLLRFMPHYHEIETLREQNPDMTILRGMEVDFFEYPKWRKGFEYAIKQLKPDYIIGSAHLVFHDGTFMNTHDWKNAKDKKLQDLLLQKYWTNVAHAAESGLFTWMAHLDLPKKVGLGHEEKWAEYESRAIEAAATTNTAIEINTSFYDHADEPYPSKRILKMAAQYNVPVIISDDAHETKNIGRHFKDAEQLISELNLKQYQR